MIAGSDSIVAERDERIAELKNVRGESHDTMYFPWVIDSKIENIMKTMELVRTGKMAIFTIEKN